MLSLTGWVSRGLVLLAMVLATASVTTSGEWGEEGESHVQPGQGDGGTVGQNHPPPFLRGWGGERDCQVPALRPKMWLKPSPAAALRSLKQRSPPISCPGAFLPGVTYAELGSHVALTCPGGNPNSTTRWQRHGGSGLPSDSGVQQGQLLLSHVDLSSEGTYSCQDGAGLPLGSVVLRVGRLPGPPSVSCRASNYENFSCFWTPSVETHLPTRYITSYLSPVKSVGPCVQDPGRPLTCTVSKSQFWSLYRVNVTEVNPLGSSFTLLNIIAQRIAKPDPPEHVRVEPVPQAPRRLRVSWEYPSSWRKELSFQLHFRLRYRPVLHDSWSVIETSNMSEEITDAIMGLEHTVQVSAKDYLDAGSWSEWSPEVRAWPAAAGQGDSVEKVATLVSLGVFAFFALVALLLFAFLVWIRAKKQSKEADKHQELLAAATHLKALPKGQIL
uniref:Interleukin-11 receptor subunit alpha n=1 Tax=Laticauda laticaudata TaxID=8630 RepID=A0A8C5S6M7_LATLA